MRSLKKLTAWLLALTVLVVSGVAVDAKPKQPDYGLFDPAYYLEKNPDVAEVYGKNNYAGAYEHFKKYGVEENRDVSPLIDLKAYAEYEDLIKAFNGNKWLIWEHYNQFGVTENRTKGVLFNPAKYAEAYPEVVALVGNDPVALAQYYIKTGRANGQVATVKVYNAAHDYNTVVSRSSARSSSGGGSSGGSSGSGGSTTKPGGDNPTTPASPVVHEHTKASFNSDGSCKTANCKVTLANFQAACTVGHDKVDTGSTCPTCGAAGTKEKHDATSVHKVGDFDGTGKCTVDEDCTLTKTAFIAACTHSYSNGVCQLCETACDDANHASTHKDKACTTCGKIGSVAHTYTGGTCSCGATCTPETCPSKAGHASIKVDATCSVCGGNGTEKYDKAACPNKGSHAYGKTCDKCNYAGECMVDHSGFYPTATCSTCGAAGTKVCSKASEHGDILQGQKCSECQLPGTKVDAVANCSNKDGHAALCAGVNCSEGCGYTGSADHDFAGGQCKKCTATLSKDACEEGHDGIDEDNPCPKCGATEK